jgi:hypothetical protein
MAVGCSASTPASPEPALTPSHELAGSYDGGQMEMAVGLELAEDGRFRYGLSYGALDEQAQGRWGAEGKNVRLTSDPVVPPRFQLLESKPVSNGRLHIDLDVPNGVSRQYFSALITMADGQVSEEQLSEEGLDLELGSAVKPVSVAMELPVNEFRGDPVKLPPGGAASLHFHFEPNDIGKVAFANQLLRNDDGVLLLERHGRLIRFRRSAE